MTALINAISALGNWLSNWFLYIIAYPLGFLQAFFAKFFSKIMYLFENTIKPFWDYIASVQSSISINGLINTYNSIPSGVIYFLDLFQAPVLLVAAFSAYAIKFIIRRLPVIG